MRFSFGNIVSVSAALMLNGPRMARTSSSLTKDWTHVRMCLLAIRFQGGRKEEKWTSGK
jgi:hypothetical protein